MLLDKQAIACSCLKNHFNLLQAKDLRGNKKRLFSDERMALMGQPFFIPQKVICLKGYIIMRGRKAELCTMKNARTFRRSDAGLPELPESIHNLLSICTLNLESPGAASKRKPPLINRRRGPRTHRCTHYLLV